MRRKLAAGRTSQAWAVTLGETDWVVRVPIPDSGRVESFRSEATIGRILIDAGHPVADWDVVELEGVRCSVAPRLTGAAIDPTEPWTDDFTAAVAGTLRTLHTLPISGFGPLCQETNDLVGTDETTVAGICGRWTHATIWPFDGTDLDTHVVAALAPELVEPIRALEGGICAVAETNIGLTHSDLHREHFLVDETGNLTALLDFGDAFIGSITWDFALIDWYYGRRNVTRFAEAYGGLGPAIADVAPLLSLVVGCYKLTKNDGDPATLDRVRQALSSASDE